MKNFHIIQIIDIIQVIQIDQLYPKKLEDEEYKGDPHNIHRDARVFAVLIRRRENKMVSDGTKTTDIKVI